MLGWEISRCKFPMLIFPFSEKSELKKDWMEFELGIYKHWNPRIKFRDEDNISKFYQCYYSYSTLPLPLFTLPLLPPPPPPLLMMSPTLPPTLSSSLSMPLLSPPHQLHNHDHQQQYHDTILPSPPNDLHCHCHHCCNCYNTLANRF